MNWSAAPVAPGDVIAGKFQVEQVLGAGGVGVVVAARHLQLDERVALKFLLPEALRSDVDVARFCREAQAAVRLRSEHVARVTDVGTLDTGSPYMVMEYLIGRDLGELIEERGAFPAQQGVDFVLQACEAIAEAHSVGFIHRDIKPSNLFLTHRADGSPLVKVLDFGIAKSTHHARIGQGDQELTRTRTMLGSPMYMSPEQVRNSRDVDERTDIWSLGVVLYELLTGSAPFGGDSVTGVVAAVIGDPVPPLAVPQLPSGLSQVVITCLEKKPQRRYQSVAELAYALKPFASRSGHVSVERIAGTLGSRARYRSEETPPRSTPTSHMAAATTVKSGSLPAKPRYPKWAAIVVAAAAVAAGLSGMLAWRSSLAPDPVRPPAAAGSVTKKPSAVAAEPGPMVMPAEEVEEPESPLEVPSAAPTTSSDLQAPPPAPPRRQAVPPARAPQNSPTPAKSSQRNPIIDSTVDTRR